MATRLQVRRGTAAQWAATNPVLAQGEPGIETDTSVFKIGDGAAAWTALAALVNPAAQAQVAATANLAASDAAAARTAATAANTTATTVSTQVGTLRPATLAQTTAGSPAGSVGDVVMVKATYSGLVHQHDPNDIPLLSVVGTTGRYSDLIGTPGADLATVFATGGVYPAAPSAARVRHFWGTVAPGGGPGESKEGDLWTKTVIDFA